jgi:glycosyltransferase involved in cell wall biosynthesis
VVHAEDTAAHAYVALRSGYPAVITVHGIRREDGRYFSSWGRRLRNYFDSMLIENYTLRHARHLIVISPYVSDYFASRLRPDLQMYHVPNAIDGRFFELSCDSGGQAVLFAGRVIPRKRVLDLVQAFARVLQHVPAAQLRIAGECDSEPAYVENIRRWIRQAGLEAHVNWLGSLSETAVLREFADCGVLALPSSQETAPMVLAQAMAAGKPVVASRVGGVAEMVGEAGERGFLVNVGEVDGLARAILRLLEAPALQTRMGQAGRAFALENYHLDRVAQRTLAAYKTIAAMEARTHA